MREKLAVLFVLILALVLIWFPLSKATTTTGTDVKPLVGAVSKSMQCYGTTAIDNTNTWSFELHCGNNEVTKKCSDSNSSGVANPNGIQIGYNHTCTGGDWATSCTDHCYMICTTSQNPPSNCQWR